LGDGIDKYTEVFEQAAGVREGEDIGGLIVYAEGARVVAVYDYENFTGWVVE
jgi:hypothetical protein